MNIFDFALPKSMPRSLIAMLFVGMAFAGSAHAAAPNVSSSYVSAGGSLLVLEFDQDLNENSLPETGDFTVEVNDTIEVPVDIVSVVRDQVILELSASILAVRSDNGEAVKILVIYIPTDGADTIESLSGETSGQFAELPINESTNFPLSISLHDPDGRVECGAWKIEMDGNSEAPFPIEAFSSYCADSMPLDGAVSGTLVFSEDSLGEIPTYCNSFESMQVNSDGNVSIITIDDCIIDRDDDGIPGVADANPDARANNHCNEEISGEVNLAASDGSTSPDFCSGIVSVVTGKDVRVTGDTQYTAGEFIRLLPLFRVEAGSAFSAKTGAFL